MFSFNGENIREKVRVTMHNLMEFLLSQQDDQSKNLLLISSVLQTLCTEGVSNPLYFFDFVRFLNDFYTYFLFRNTIFESFFKFKQSKQTYLVSAEFSSAQEEYKNKLQRSDTGTTCWTIWHFWTADFLISKSLSFINIMNSLNKYTLFTNSTSKLVRNNIYSCLSTIKIFDDVCSLVTKCYR